MANMGNVPDETQAPPPQVQADSSAPANASHEKSDTDNETPRSAEHGQDLNVVPLLPGRRPIRTPGEVTPEMKEELHDLVAKPMLIHYKGSNLCPIPWLDDFEKLLKGVFAGGWVTGEAHKMCGKEPLEPVSEELIGFYTLHVDAILAGAIKGDDGKPVRFRSDVKAFLARKEASRQAATKYKITKSTLKKEILADTRNRPDGAFGTHIYLGDKEKLAGWATLDGNKFLNVGDFVDLINEEGIARFAPDEFSRFRHACAYVYLGCEEGPGGSVKFTLFNEQHTPISKEQLRRYKIHSMYGSQASTRGLVMQLHDMSQADRGVRYNLLAAVFLARNRLTHWANGNAVWTRPEGEDTDLFVEYTLMRNLRCADEAAMEICKKLPATKLSECMDRLFSKYPVPWG